MALLFDTRDLAPGRRREAVLDALCSTAAPLEVALPRDRSDVAYRFEGWRLGRAYLHLSTGSALRLRRTESLVQRQPQELVSFTFLVSGAAAHRQGDFHHADEPGQVSVVESSTPWESRYAEGSTMGSVSLDLADLGLPMDLIRRSAALTRASPVKGLVGRHLAALAQVGHVLDDPWQADALGAATVELLRALLASTCEDVAAGAGTMQTTLLTRIHAYIDQHLGDRDLCAASIAAQHHISVRLLYKLWPATGPSLGRTILHARLRAAQRELGQFPKRTVAAVAVRWGFADPVRFSRHFKDMYGLSPRDWRQFQQTTGDDPIGRGGAATL